MKNGDKYEGFCVDVLTELSRSLKFDYEIFELEGSTINQNGKSTVWDDIITQLKVGVSMIFFDIVSNYINYAITNSLVKLFL
jgi:hypothetical protein